MPRPWLRLAILAFWLCTSAWLAWVEAERRWLRSDEPPPYAIDLVDEAQRNQEIQWSLRHNGEDSYRAVSSVRYHADDDTFELRVEIKARSPEGGLPRADVPFDRLVSVQHVTREGTLRRLTVEAVLTAGLGSFTFEGEVRGRQLHGSFTYDIPSFQKSGGGDIEPVAVPSNGSVLTPLHPHNRIKNIRPGQSWKMPLVDPMDDVLPAVLKKLGFSLPRELLEAERALVLDAHVQSAEEEVLWNKRRVTCSVIVYKEGGELRARTYLQKDTGLVLRQVAVRGDESWEFERETPID
jgi:hypothetical protein